MWNASADRFDFSHGLRINADAQSLTVGASGDFALSHNGTDTFMANNTGHFYITTTSDDKDIIFRTDDGSGGVTSYFRVDGSTENVIYQKNLKLQDNVKAQFGTGNDLEIFHNGTNSVINDAGTGDLIFQIAGSEKGRITSTAFSFQGGYSATGSFNTTLGAYQINGTTVIDSSRNLIPNEIFLPQKITHFGDNDTHIQFPSDDTFTITTAGTERMRVDSGGKLLVGKTTADATNTVGHELKANGIAVHTTDDTGTMFLNRKTSHGKIIELRKDNSAVGVIGTQNWGIGTSSPSTNLHISSTTPKVRLTDSDTNADSDISASSSNGSLFLSADTNDEVANTVLGFQVDGSTKFYVGTDGFYAIGTKIIDASTRNLTNIGTISSGAITSTGTITSSATTGFVASSTSGTGLTTNNAVYFRIVAPAVESGHTSKHELSMGWSSDRARTYQAPKNDGTFNFNHEFGYNFQSGQECWYFEDKLKVGNLNIGDTTVIDSSRNLLNLESIVMPDSKVIKIGTDLDLQLLHDGSNSIIKNVATGNLIIRNVVDDGDIILQSDDGSGGLTNYITLDGSEAQTRFNQDVKFGDSKVLKFGTGNDLQIYHNGSNSYIDDTGTGNLFIRSNEIRLNKYTGEFMIRAIADGAVTLYHDNSAKIATTATGIDVSGIAVVNRWLNIFSSDY